MVVFEYHRIELDYCPTCMGVWFDAEEIRLLLEHAGMPEGLRQPNFMEVQTLVHEARRRCPLCLKLMDKRSMPGDVIVDRCPNGDGVWFDAGEMSRIAVALGSGRTDLEAPVRTIAEFLGEALDRADRS